MQRGAGPGANWGDFGLIGFVSARLSRSVNVSSNFGIILASNPQSKEFGIEKATLLDRSNEALLGVGVDFRINEHFQPIAELKTVRYWGSRTETGFHNNHVDLLPD